MAWWKRKTESAIAGSVLFRGKWPARHTDFAFLERQGIHLAPSPRSEDGAWTAKLTHAEWGEATLTFDPDLPLLPRELIDWDPRLTTEEKALAMQGGSSIGVTMQPRIGNVLRDRKELLRYLHAVMGDDGLCAVDHTAQSFWSRQALELELAHDADLDIDALYTTHLITQPRPRGGRARPGVLAALARIGRDRVLGLRRARALRRAQRGGARPGARPRLCQRGGPPDRRRASASGWWTAWTWWAWTRGPFAHAAISVTTWRGARTWTRRTSRATWSSASRRQGPGSSGACWDVTVRGPRRSCRIHSPGASSSSSPRRPRSCWPIDRGERWASSMRCARSSGSWSRRPW